MSGGAKAWSLWGTAFGEGEEFSFANHRVMNHWGGTGDLADCASPIEVNDLFGKNIPNAPGRERFAVVHQLWLFRSAIHVGDVIAAPRATLDGTVAVGVCAGPYQFVERHGMVSQHHTLPVAWINTTARIASLQPDLAKPLSGQRDSFNMVVELTAPDAAARLLLHATTGTDPGPLRSIER